MARILVTGCAGGVGRETARLLAARGHDVVATARRLEPLAGLDVAQRLVLDVTDDRSVQRAAAAAGAVDVLVNNAAVGAHGPVEAVRPESARTAWETNVEGVLRTVRAFAPGMRSRRAGVIVNVSSAAGRFAMPLAGVYGATKHAVEALSEALRFELGHFGVRVLLIEPGVIATGLNAASVADAVVPADYRDLADQLWGRPGRDPGWNGSTAADVAIAIADAVDDPTGPFRRPVGADARSALQARAALGDADFDALLRNTLDVTW